MNCAETQRLLLAERDGPPPARDAAALSAHLAGCPGCRRLAADLRAGFQAWAEESRAVPVPDAEQVWRDLQAARARRPAPVRPAWVRVGLPLAAAAAIALLLVQVPWRPALPPTADSGLARVDYVVPGAPGASTLVYEDRESGWLVVWTAESEPL